MSKILKHVEITKEQLDDLEKNGVVDIDYKGWSYQIETKKGFYEKDYIVTLIAPSKDKSTGNYVQIIFYEEETKGKE